MYGCDIRPEIDAVLEQLSAAIYREDDVCVGELISLLQRWRDLNYLTVDEIYMCLGYILVGLPDAAMLHGALNAARKDWRQYIQDYRRNREKKQVKAGDALGNAAAD